MQETQIKVEILEHKNLFPIFIRFLTKKLNMEVNYIKAYKNYFVIESKSSKDKCFILVENFYWLNDFFKVQKVTFDYK